MKLLFTEDFLKEFKKIKDKTTRVRILKHLQRLEQLPESGKPLQYSLKSHRSVRVPPFRIIYRLEQDKIIINCFDNREEVYK